MKRIQNDDLRQLLLQLKFAPLKQRIKQLDAAEKLFALIDKTMDYPFEFICFHITGFRPTGPDAEKLIKGEELSEDLRNFIASLSSRVCPPASQQGQKVYTLEELAKTLNVSARTINRWRSRGLIARKFLFQNEQKCLGFLQSSVDKFLDVNPDLIANAKNFRRLTKPQKNRIVKRAASLAAKTPFTRHRIIQKVACDMGVSPETVRCILLNYENANRGKPVFKRPTGVINSAQAAEIYKLFQTGTPAGDLMKRFNRTKSSIYRIINDRRARAVAARKIEFIASEEFLRPDAAQAILAEPLDVKKIASPKKIDLPRPADGSLARYLQTVKAAPILNRDREMNFFRRYNFLKFLASQAMPALKPARAPSAQIRKTEDCLAEAEAVKKMIIEASLRLVVGIARKHAAASGANLLDLISEGNLSLVRAVEKFDYTRGFRFATYAAWVIAKDYAHHPEQQPGRLDKSEAMENIQRNLRITDSSDFAAIERAHKSLIAVIKDNLDQREQYVIINHFGLMGTLVKKERKTLTQIGQELNLSKERVRQLELVALQKLRHSLSPEQFDLLTS